MEPKNSKVMTTQLLTPAEAKKGMKVYLVSSYNHFYNQKRNPAHYRDSKGHCIYTPHSKDVYMITEATIHSCGAKLLRYIDKDGVLSGRDHTLKQRTVENWMQVEGTYGWFVKSHEEATLLALELAREDEYGTDIFEIHSR